MTTPDSVSADTYRTCLEEALALLDGLASVEVRARSVRLAEVAYAWSQQIIRLARGVLVLTDAGLAHEARVLLRSLLEFTVTLHWAIKSGDDAVDAVLAEYQRSIRNIATDGADGPFGRFGPLMADVLEVRIDEVDEVETLRRFRAICRQLGLVNTLYVVYRVESGYAHPRWPTVEAFVADVDGQTVFLREPRSLGSGTIAMTTCCVIWAGRALDELVLTRPLRKPLSDLARRIGANRVLPEMQ